jgi:hypothetical protein
MSSSSKTPQSVDPLECLPKSYIQLYIGISELQRAITAKSEALLSKATSQQYLAFLRVFRKNYEEVEILCTEIREHYRMSYYESEEVLMIKLVVEAAHKTPHCMFNAMFSWKQFAMGVSEWDLACRGQTKCAGPASFKMSDASYHFAFLRIAQND